MTADSLEPGSSLMRAAEELAGRHHISYQRPGLVAAWQKLDSANQWLHDARLACVDPPPEAGKAAEWLLDNDYHVCRALRQIAKDLPPGFYARLPALANEEGQPPRIFAVAHEYLCQTHLQVSLSTAVRFVRAYQRGKPLTIAELWAFPAMLRIACVEILVVALTSLLDDRVELPFESSPCAVDPHSLDATERVARAVANLRIIASIPWMDFFDRTSRVEEILEEDPSRFYCSMDFQTRDSYRRVIEEIARDSAADESVVAKRAIEQAGRAAAEDAAHHVGYWLVGGGRHALERMLGAVPPLSSRIARNILARPGILYTFVMVLAGLGAVVLPASYLVLVGASPGGWAAGLVLSLVPASVLTVTLVHWAITRTVPPRILPKLDYSKGLPRDARTVIVVPVVLAGSSDVAQISEQLEMHWLANVDPMVRVALLADLADALEERMPGDDVIVEALQAAILNLNRRYARGGPGPFHLLLRPRRYNPSQRCWMAWERKRGKLEQFNRMLAEGDDSHFSLHVGHRPALDGIRFVVTVDADTRLPPGSVAKLAGTLAHPLNQARISPTTGCVTSGYSIIQPRVEISPQSGIRTLFARLFTGDTAIDIYSRAVSDVYQDLFGTGIFVGKGIYDLRAFHASVDRRVPENRILSHDLFEGAHGRAGLATDIVLYENFPASYPEYTRRLHRWIRGDWQLLAWLWPWVPGPQGKRLRSHIPGIERWKMFDNLRRSLIPPCLLILALAGWFFLPGRPWFWTILVLLAPAGQLFTDIVSGLARGRRVGASYGFLSRLSDQAGRWLLAIVYLLHEALLALHAITVTLWRCFISHRNMLEWTAAAHVAARLGDPNSRARIWSEMWVGPVLALATAGLLAVLRLSALPVALPLLLVWIAAPEITLMIGRPRIAAAAPLGKGDARFLRRLARRTWLYFETFAGPEDHWLPPDNYQGAPHEEIAHRTSPTNIGMLLLSTATAWDLGFLGRVELQARTRNVFESLVLLERYRGHFYNWYETRHLKPLEPRYVSTVDSGNLAVSLVAYAETLRDAAAECDLEPQRWQGLHDILGLLEESLEKFPTEGASLLQRIGEFRSCLAEASDLPVKHERLLCDLWESGLPAIEDEACRLIKQLASPPDEALHDLNAWLDRLRHHLQSMRRDLADPGEHSEELRALADEAITLAWSMDFAPLYDRERRLFHIGHNVSSSRTDFHHYDLLASEARLASFFAIAKGDVPIEHWFYLERPVTRAPGGLALISWNGSMFEYLMPRLLLRSEPDTLLGESERVAVDVQRRYGESNGHPWGISESAYSGRDPEHRYRYQAFGVPSLGLRRGLTRDMVVAPYASALALAVAPGQATANLKRLSALGVGGRYGLWEAVDFTPDRLAAETAFTPVIAYMAHHQGMTMCAIGNVLNGDRLVSRFGRVPQIRLVSLLLSERVPHEIPPEIKRLETLERQVLPLAQLPVVESWEPGRTSFRQIHLLGNGRLASWISEAGGGGLRWHGQALTRFVPDATRDAEGLWLYLRDEDSGEVWSATSEPTGAQADEYRCSFHPHLAEFHRRDHGIDLRLEIGVGESDDLEIRRVTLVNETDHPRRLCLTTYAEVVLAPPLEDERHPAFSKLFVGGEFLPGVGGLLFRRRPRGPRETPAVLLQLVIGADGPLDVLRYECDRRALIGRNRSFRDPLAAHNDLADHAGWTLDPVAALQFSVELKPGQRREFGILTVAAATRETAVEIAERHSTLSSIDWVLDDAATAAARAIHRSGVAPDALPPLQSLGSLLVYPQAALRADPDRVRGNELGQSGLWGMALSGDFPILLLRGDGGNSELLSLLAGAHQLWRRHGREVDLVILQTGGSAYVEPVRDEIIQLLRDIGASELLGRNGGLHLLFADQIGQAQVALIEAMAWVILDEKEGTLLQQLAAARKPPLELPPIFASMADKPEASLPLERPEDLLFDNGIGGFTPDGREYVMHLGPGETTPMPWANVLANDRFGTLVTESGGGFTWSLNSGEYRLTPWTNDPVSDRPVETLYLRDEETTAVWTVTPVPAGAETACQIRHGAGYSEWRKSWRGIDQELRVFVPHDAPVKLVRLRLRNQGERHRRLTATYYVEWLLGSLPGIARRHVHCDFDGATQAILATSPWNADFAGRAAFLTASQAAHGYTTDRREFLGDWDGQSPPAALRRWGLAGTLVAGEDACAAYQVHVDLQPGESAEVVFVLGEGHDQSEAKLLAAKWRAPEAAGQAEIALADYWDGLLGAVEVRTPDPAFDILVNRWLIYQSLSSRIFARTGFYQASGAFGFRDQLQDVLALLHADPARTRAHILACAAHQFEEGDVLHWWHPPADRGVRTRCSDDYLWLPYAVGTYVRATGDLTIFEEHVPFLSAPPLARDEEDRYTRFEHGDVHYPLIDHCERALERLAWGAHGLPLMGSGDWNDGMDRVGHAGRGESVWLAWFAAVSADLLADLERRLGRRQEADHWHERASGLRRYAEENGWDGAWYRRAYDDDGHPLGSAGEAECRIDSISQSWAAFAGAEPGRVQEALDAARRELVDEDASLARLLWPPFDTGPRDPGYIKAYPPGIRENGGQYAHAAAWLGLAMAKTGQGDAAHAIFNMLSPIRRSDTREKAELYRIEPYAVAGDIAAAGEHRGKGGWSWYTGAAAWAWRLAVEGLLGVTLQDGKLHVAPVLPQDWAGYEATLRKGRGTIFLEVKNSGAATTGQDTSLWIDGVQVEGSTIAFPTEGSVNVLIRLG